MINIAKERFIAAIDREYTKIMSERSYNVIEIKILKEVKDQVSEVILEL